MGSDNVKYLYRMIENLSNNQTATPSLGLVENPYIQKFLDSKGESFDLIEATSMLGEVTGWFGEIVYLNE